MTKNELEKAKYYEEVPLDAYGVDNKLYVRARRKVTKTLRKKGLIKTFIGGGGHELPLNEEDMELVDQHMPKTKFIIAP